jgi:hypothetical protein
VAFLLFAAVATAEKSMYQKLKEKISNHFKDGEWTRETEKNKDHCLKRCDGVAWKVSRSLFGLENIYLIPYLQLVASCLESRFLPKEIRRVS